MNTGFNTGHIYGGIPVFGIPVLEALVLLSGMQHTSRPCSVHWRVTAPYKLLYYYYYYYVHTAPHYTNISLINKNLMWNY